MLLFLDIIHDPEHVQSLALNVLTEVDLASAATLFSSWQALPFSPSKRIQGKLAKLHRLFAEQNVDLNMQASHLSMSECILQF